MAADDAFADFSYTQPSFEVSVEQVEKFQAVLTEKLAKAAAKKKARAKKEAKRVAEENERKRREAEEKERARAKRLEFSLNKRQQSKY